MRFDGVDVKDGHTPTVLVAAHTQHLRMSAVNAKANLQGRWVHCVGSMCCAAHYGGLLTLQVYALSSESEHHAASALLHLTLLGCVL